MVCSISLFLFGCQSKGTATTGVTATPPADSSASTATTGTGTAATAQAAATIQNKDEIDAFYAKNFKTAAAEAASMLKGKADLCSVIYRFPGATITTFGDLSFLFYNDSVSKDYYWVENFDGIRSNTKRRYFAARVDFKDLVQCVPTQVNDAPNLTAGMEEFLSTAQYQNINQTDVAEVVMSYVGSFWRIDFYSTDGTLMLSYDSGQKTTAAASATATTATAQ